MHKIKFILNPEAFGGKSKARWKTCIEHWPVLQYADVSWTTYPGEAVSLAKQTQDRDICVAGGGDGTVSEVVSGLMQIEADRPAFAVLPIGSGNDFARNLGIHNLSQAISSIYSGETKKVDVLEVTCRNNEDVIVKYGLGVVNIGLGATQFACNNTWLKRLAGGKISYYISALVSLFRQKAIPVKVSMEKNNYEGKCWMVIASNSEWAGAGGMRLAPGAKIDDGLMMVTIIPEMWRSKILMKMTKLRTGSHLRDPELLFYHTSDFSLQTTDTACVELDGDPLGFAPVSIKLLHKALNVMSI